MTINVRLLAWTAFAALTLAAAPAAVKLLPLSDKDQNRILESGCNFGFGPGNTSLIFAINESLVLRTRPGFAGLAVCKFPSDKMNAFQDDGGKLVCGGLELSLRRTGKVKGHPEADSSTWPAALTIRNLARGQTTIVRGEAGVAC